MIPIEPIFKLISKDTRPLNILELCCGTGRQSEYLINHYINSSIDLLDISQDSLNQIKLLPEVRKLDTELKKPVSYTHLTLPTKA